MKQYTNSPPPQKSDSILLIYSTKPKLRLRLQNMLMPYGDTNLGFKVALFFFFLSNTFKLLPLKKLR